MNPERFTVKTGEAVQAAQRAAREAGHPQLTNLHLLAALLEQRDGTTPPLLAKIGVSVESVLDQVRRGLSRLPRVQGEVQLAAAPEVSRLFDAAEREMERLKDEYLSTEHLLLGLASADNPGPAARLLRDAGANRESLYRALGEVRGGARVTDPEPEDKYQVLKKYCRDLTEAARKGNSIP